MDSSDVAELTLMDRGDSFSLYSDEVHDGSDRRSRLQIGQVMRDHRNEPARTICKAILEYAVKQDDYLRQINETNRIDDKTVFIIKRI
jgi:hypothetical protein